jgi:hypothetical protein
VLILVHVAHPQALTFAGPGFGRLLSPRHFYRVAESASAGIPWAADNDAFNGFDVAQYEVMLAAIKGVPGCLFVTAPDSVGDWRRTRELYDAWRVQLDGYRVAYVIQDGQPSERVPWDGIECLFIGGTTAYKLSVEAERLAREAKARGLWLHMGRVNSRRRYDYARAIGCDSIDGTSFSKWRDRWLPRALAWQGEPMQERLAL